MRVSLLAFLLVLMGACSACAGAAPAYEPERRPEPIAPEPEPMRDAGTDAGADDGALDAGTPDAGATSAAARPSDERAGVARWSARACAGRGLPVREQSAEATVLPDGTIRVRIVDQGSDAVLGERIVTAPTWHTRAGAHCTAMGIADAAIVRSGRARAVRVEISVGDLCERNAPRCTVVTLP